MNETALDPIVSLAKRRGFVFPSSEIYGGIANTWDYGPLGVELKQNIKNFWWKRFVHERADMVGIDAALIMNPKVWEASGHLKEFSDPLVECKACHSRFRVDELLDVDTTRGIKMLLSSVQQSVILDGKIDLEEFVARKLSETVCRSCNIKGNWSLPKQFNLMLKTFLGPAEETANMVYFRPETAQGMFVNFKNILDTARMKLPFGIAQIGKAFRNEITPGNFIFRTREFEQMEIEYFIPVPDADGDWNAHFEYWRTQMRDWIKAIGIDLAHVHEVEVPEGERAHYSKRTLDFEYDFPFGRKELYGLAYRTDFDLRNHEKFSGENLKYKDPDTGEEFWPHVIEPTWGVDRTVLAVLLDAYTENKDRSVLKLKPHLAPYKAAVFPLLANKPNLVEKARGIYDALRASFAVTFDDRGNIGKRYYSQDEIGTPHCITIDFQTLEDDTVTVRDRDTMQQERVAAQGLQEYIEEKVKITAVNLKKFVLKPSS